VEEDDPFARFINDTREGSLVASPTDNLTPQDLRFSPWVVGKMLAAAGLLSVLVGGSVHTIWGKVASALVLKKPPLTDNGLVVSPERLDFGLTWESSEFTWMLPIENRRREAVEIEQFVPGCDCVMVDPQSLVIPAGETREKHERFVYSWI
jgi:hypothetical protein